MTPKDLIKANLLADIIKSTENGLEELCKIKFSVKPDDHKDNILDDGQYKLVIGQYDDRSGYCANLARYAGNAELLEVIIATLEAQLEKFKKEFEAI